MAIKRGNFISGSIANVVFKENKGKQIIQSAPGAKGVKQSESTKKAAILFGKASSLGEVIRYMLEDVIMGFYDGPMVNRLTTTLQTILAHHCDNEKRIYDFNQNSFNRLKGFDFNLKSMVRDFLWCSPESILGIGTLTLTFPKMKIQKDFKFPTSTSSCTIDVIVNFFNLNTGFLYTTPEIQRIKVEKTQAVVEKQDLIFSVPEGCLCIAAINLRYSAIRYRHSVPYSSKDFHPAEICAAFITPGIFDLQNTKKWRKTDTCFITASDMSSTTDLASPH